MSRVGSDSSRRVSAMNGQPTRRRAIGCVRPTSAPGAIRDPIATSECFIAATIRSSETSDAAQSASQRSRSSPEASSIPRRRQRDGNGLLLVVSRHHHRQPRLGHRVNNRRRMSAPTSSSRRATLGALGLYLALSAFFFALPLAGDLRDHAIAADQLDSSAYMWFFAWWPDALGDGFGAIHTEHVFVPEGYNLAWTTAMPGPSMVLAPLTLAFGPLATWNAIMLIGPALAAWAAFLLCRELTGATLPALAGGYLFGFSPYMLGNVQGSPNLVLVWLLPPLVLLGVRHARGKLGARAFVALMTAALAFQFLTSTEVLAMTGVFGGLTLVAAWLLLPEWRTRLVETLKLLVMASAAAVIVVSPLLFYMLFEPYTVPEQARGSFPADLLSWVVPSSYIGLATGHDPGDGPSYATGFGYLGVPLALLLVVFAVDGRRRPAGRGRLLPPARPALGPPRPPPPGGGEDTGIPLPRAGFSR